MLENGYSESHHFQEDQDSLVRKSSPNPGFWEEIFLFWKIWKIQVKSWDRGVKNFKKIANGRFSALWGFGIVLMSQRLSRWEFFPFKREFLFKNKNLEIFYEKYFSQSNLHFIWFVLGLILPWFQIDSPIHLFSDLQMDQPFSKQTLKRYKYMQQQKKHWKNNKNFPKRPWDASFCKMIQIPPKNRPAR